MIGRVITNTIAALLFATVLVGAATATRAQDVTVNISVKDHKFTPAEVKAPANKRLMIHVRNLDATPMEFESNSLRVEKVVTANGAGQIRVRPLAPGRYEFFDDFHRSATGALVVE